MAYQHILVPVDGSPTSFSAIRQAAELAKAFDSKVTAILVLTTDPFIGVEFIDVQNQAKDLISEARAYAHNILEDAKQKFEALGVAVDTRIVDGQIIAKEIVRTAEELHADLLVIGSHGRKGFKKLVLGSVAQSVLGDAHLPVLVVRSE